jgi:hypothetical protein
MTSQAPSYPSMSSHVGQRVTTELSDVPPEPPVAALVARTNSRVSRVPSSRPYMTASRWMVIQLISGP